MKIKSAIAAATLALLASAASATTTGITTVSGTFDDIALGEITFLSTSTVTGLAGYVSALTFSSGGTTYTIDASSITFSEVSLYSSTGTLISSSGSSSFNFANLASGTYTLKVSGSVNGSGSAYAVADYNVSAVPEPESYAMLLAGLGVMGAIARRRSKTTA